jgi:hypothetical protein
VALNAPDISRLPDGYQIGSGGTNFGTRPWSTTERSQWTSAGLLDTNEPVGGQIYNYNIRGARMTKHTDATAGAYLRCHIPVNTSGDAPQSQRAEYQIAGTTNFPPGTRKFFGFKLRSPTGVAMTDTFNLPFQSKNAGVGSPPFQFWWLSNQLGCGAPASGDRFVLFSGAPPRNVWINIFFEIVYQRGSGVGTVRGWYNPASATAAPVFQDTAYFAADNGTGGASALGNGGTIWTNRTAGYFKAGMYCRSMQSSVREIDHARPCVGDTLAEVFNHVGAAGGGEPPPPPPTSQRAAPSAPVQID